MKIAILANNKTDFINPLARGLHSMLSKLNVDSDVLYDGHKWLTNPNHRTATGKINYTNLAKKIIKEIYCKTVFCRKLKKYDIIVAVINMPSSFLKTYMQNLDIIRKNLNTPIVNYDLHYLGTRGPWIDWILNGNPVHNILPGIGYGLERYDYYLMLSVVNEFPMPKAAHPCSVIGADLNDGTLFSEQNEKFIALLDFERKNFLPERKIQIEALEETNTDYLILDRKYTLDEIRSIYRKTAICFLAHRESFGLPICELQACGSYIFSPYEHWAGSHYIKDIYLPWEENLSSNFIIYNNEKELLKNEIIRIKRNYNPHKVIENFRNNYPHYWEGDLDKLSEFIKKVKAGEIHSQLHKEHMALNDTIIRKIQE